MVLRSFGALLICTVGWWGVLKTENNTITKNKEAGDGLAFLGGTCLYRSTGIIRDAI